MFNGRLLAVMVSLAAPGAACAAADVGLPSGWRAPTAAENAANLKQAQANGGAVRQVRSVKADFDGDGRWDEAVILVNDATQRFAVFVRRASAGRYDLIADVDGSDVLWNYTLRSIRPGHHEPACARGIGNDDGPCPKLVRNRWPAFSVVALEASEILYYWNGRAFVSEALSD